MKYKVKSRINILDLNDEKFWGEGPYRLLEAVIETGSLRAASSKLYMAYTKALKLIRTAEEALGFPLTVRVVGGRNGGGSIVTEQALDWMKNYREYRDACAGINEELFRKHFHDYLTDDKDLSQTVSDIGCIIMASGMSRRFGDNKLLCDFGGKPLACRIIDSASEVFSELAVVTRHDEIAKICKARGVRCILHDYPGRNDTIRLGLEELGSGLKGYMFCPCDQPFLSKDTLKRLSEAYLSCDDNSLIVRAEASGSPGMPVLFGSAYYEELTKLPEGLGGGIIIRENASSLKLIETNENELLDIDTPSDYAKCLSILNNDMIICRDSVISDASESSISKNLVVVRGAGDIATGIIIRLKNSGFDVIALESDSPYSIRRKVSFSEAVYDGESSVEGVLARLADNEDEALSIAESGDVAVISDPAGCSIEKLRPFALVDAVMAKRNLGTDRTMAPVTVGIGPGFTAGSDVDAVIETQRGHNLGRVIYEGSATANTGIPGEICGYSSERVIHSPASGTISPVRSIADTVSSGETIAIIKSGDSEVPVAASIDGILRGMIRDGYAVKKGLKIADIDPRLDEADNCFTISDKARCVAGGVLEAIMHLRKEKSL